MKAISKVYTTLVILGIIIILLIIIPTKISHIGIIILALYIAYLILSIKIINADKIATIVLLGRALGDVESGVMIAPAGIVKVVSFPRTIFNDELPGNPELIFGEEGKIPDGMFRPIRIKFGNPDPLDIDLINDPYNVCMVVDVVPVVNWRISNATLFFVNIGSIEKLRVILSDKVVADFGVKFSTMTPAKAGKILDQISDELKTKLITETIEWGIKVNNTDIKPFNFSHHMNTAVVGVSVAKLNKKSAIETGIGAAEVKRLMIEAEAVGMTKLGKLAKTEQGKYVIYLQTLQKAFENADYSIIPGGDLFSAFAGIKEMLTKINGGK
jgi:regulator of protease activity HflC (stomatin/prohibitin superfamily)